MAIKKFFKSSFKILIILSVSAGLILTLLPAIVASSWFGEKLTKYLSSQLSREVTLKQPVGLQLLGSPGLRISSFQIANSEGTLLELGGAELILSFVDLFSGKITANQLRISDLAISIRRDASGRLNWDFADPVENASASVPVDTQSPPDLGFLAIKELLLTNIILRLEEQDPPHEFIIRKLSAKNLSMTQPVELQADLLLDQKPLALNARLRTEGDFLRASNLRFDLDIKQDQNQIRTSGEYQFSGLLQAKIDASGSDLSMLALPYLPALPAYSDYKIETKFALTPGKLKFQQSSINFQGNDLSGDLEIQLSEPIFLQGKLNSKSLDIQSLLLKGSESSAEMAPDSAKASAEQESEMHIPFEALRELNSDLALQVVSLKVSPGLEFDQTSLSVRLHEGNLELYDFQANSFGGSIRGALTSSPDSSSLELEIKNLDSNQLMSFSGAEPVLKGNFNLNLDLKSKGEKLSEILSQLEGNMELSSEQAEYVNSSAEAFSSGLAEILSPILGNAKKANIQCLLLRSQLKSGIAQSQEQVLKFGEVFIFAKGKIDFLKSKIDYNFHVNSSNPSLASLVPPFRAYGELSNPVFLPSASATVASVLDTAQGLTQTAGELLGGVSGFVLWDRAKKLEGLELCSAAYAAEQRMISSQIGTLIE